MITVSNPEPHLETSDTAIGEDFYEDGANRFWIKDLRGDWIHLTKDLYRLELKQRGMCAVCDYKEGEDLSQVDAEVIKTVKERRVQYAGALAGWNRGLQTFEDTRALVIRSPKLTKPVAGQFPLLWEFLESRFSVGEVDQLPYLLGWWQEALQALYAGRPSMGMCVVLAGEAGCGKTLLKNIIKTSMGNKEVYPYDWMTGKDTFNKELTEAPLWVVDDEAADTAYYKRNAFGAQIKKVCGNTAMRCRGLYKDGLTLEPLRRLIICLNCEPDKLQVLPELADDINDKLLIFLLASGPFPLPMRVQAEKDAFFQGVVDELPSFIHWLLHEYRIPDAYIGDRYAVNQYANSEVVAMLHELSTEAELDQVLNRYLFTPTYDKFTGTCSELISILVNDDTGLPASAKKAWYLRGSSVLGNLLHKLEKHDSKRYHYHRLGQRREWTITSKIQPPTAGDPLNDE